MVSAFLALAILGSPDRVVVAPPITSVVSNVQRLREVCTPDGNFDACTRFVAFRLTASCAPRGDGWSIDASATFRPWIFLYNMHSLAHERMHIDDVRSYAERYVDGLGGAPFASRQQCESAALAASASFEATMRDFARRSNELRHRSVLRAAR
jgi:hypothetical protein